MSDKHDVDYMEGLPSVKTSKRKTCERHCKRFWWIYLISTICIVVLVVCLVIFVAVPSIAQDKLNDARLELVSVVLSQTESESYTMEISSIIHTDGSIGATIDPFEGVIYLEDLEPHTPFARVQFPQTNGDKRQVITVREEVDIDDMDAFTTFNTWVVNNETLRITVEGNTRVRTTGLSRKYDVDFKKTVQIRGLNALRGTEVIEEQSHISAEGDDEGRNFQGVAEIPNPSIFTLEIGNVSFINFVDGERLGALYINDLSLRPGTNRANVSATLDQFALLRIGSSSDYCDEGIIPFHLRGDNVTNHGQDLGYFANALATVNLTVDIDVGFLLEQDLGMNLTCFGEGNPLDMLPDEILPPGDDMMPPDELLESLEDLGDLLTAGGSPPQ